MQEGPDPAAASATPNGTDSPPRRLLEASQSTDVDGNVEHLPKNAELERRSVRRRPGNNPYGSRGTLKCERCRVLAFRVSPQYDHAYLILVRI